MSSHRAVFALAAIALVACEVPRKESLGDTPREKAKSGKVEYPQLEVHEQPHDEKVPVVPMPGMPTRTPYKRWPRAPSGTPLDKTAAVQALKNISYKDCGSGGPGKVTVTFAPTGSVRHATVTAGDYDAATKSCLELRFRAAKIPEFDGDDANVGWSINL